MEQKSLEAVFAKLVSGSGLGDSAVEYLKSEGWDEVKAAIAWLSIVTPDQRVNRTGRQRRWREARSLRSSAAGYAHC